MGLPLDDTVLKQIQIPLCLGDSSTWTCYETSWMVAITRNHKNDYHGSTALNMETYSENQTPLSLGQSSTWTCRQLSWMAAITRNHKNRCHWSTIKDRDLQQNQQSQNLGQSKLECCRLYWIVAITMNIAKYQGVKKILWWLVQFGLA